ncbi:MAG: hypothetical protein UV51_C0010G0036 [Candidatus Woesebacteria bacterium GW2011_GWC1_42_9]|nr:MAG: hypothetical protein UV51_C0010G0036 [Candidatus Woesebacteria bacterium GW2011_GWC1_42_9]
METKEQKRGKLLADRLTLLNDFILNHKDTGLTFGEYLKELDVPSEAHFLSGLPDELVIPGIGLATAESKSLFEYTKTMNLVYYDQYLKHLVKGGDYFSFDQDLSAGLSNEDQYHNGFGSWVKETAGNVVNAAKNVTSTVVTTVQHTVQNVGSGVKSAADKAKDAVKNTTQTLKDKAKTLGAKIKKQGIIGTANKFNPTMVAMRASYLGLVVINAFNLAKNSAMVRASGGTNWKKFVKKFTVMGGSEAKLNESIDKGKGKSKPAMRIKDAIKNKISADGEYHNVVAEGTAAAITAAVAAATPLIVMTVTLIKQHKAKKGMPLTEDENTEIPDTLPLDPGTDEALDDIDNGLTELDESFFSKFKIPIFVVGGLAVSGILALLLIPKGKK